MLGKKAWATMIAVLTVALVISAPATALALVVRQGDLVSVPRGESIPDDLYAFGNTITIDGDVDGDVIAFGQVVVVAGQVSGSVISAAQTVRVDGTVDGSVRAAGQMVDVGGQVRGDLVAAASQVTARGNVARDLAASAQTVGISGNVGRNVMAACQSLTIDGDVGGNVQAQSADVTVGDTATINGDLEYWSTEQANVQGTVSGATTRHEPPSSKRTGNAPGDMAAGILASMIAWFQSFVGVAVLGLLLVVLARRQMHTGSQAVLNRPWPSLGVGALVFFVTPLVAVFIFVFGLFIGAWWLAFVLLAAAWLLLLGGVIVGSLALGRLLLRHASNGGEPIPVWSLMLGLVLVWLVGAVPVLGALAGWVVMMLGTGAIVLAWMGKGEAPIQAPQQLASAENPTL